MLDSKVIDIIFERKINNHYELIRNRFQSVIAIVYSPYFEILKNSNKFLSENELKYFERFTIESRRHSFLLGRLASKIALAHFLGDANLRANEINIGVFLFPVVAKGHALISISHSDQIGIAVAGDCEHPIAVDLEKIMKSEAYIGLGFEKELELFTTIELDLNTKYTVLWSAREALGKALKTGLTVPLDVFAIQKIHHLEGCLQILFVNFLQYQVLTFHCMGYVVSLACPKNSRTDTQYISKSIHKFFEIEN